MYYFYFMNVRKTIDSINALILSMLEYLTKFRK